MRHRPIRRAGGLAALALITALVAPVAASAEAPEVAVCNLIDEAREAITGQRDRLAADPAHATRLIERLAVPRIDTRRTARYVLGVAWRDAAPDRREGFREAFTRHTAATYGAILHRYADDIAAAAEQVSVRCEPLKRTGDRAVVRTVFGLDDAPERAVEVHVHARNGDWQVFDVRFAGISLLQGWRADVGARLERQSLAELIAALRARHGDGATGESNDTQ